MRSVFGAGAAQVALSGLVLGGLLLLDHFQWKSALVVGVALALSSTAVGLQLLSGAQGDQQRPWPASGWPSCCSRT